MFFWWFEKRFFSESRVMCGFKGCSRGGFLVVFVVLR